LAQLRPQESAVPIEIVAADPGWPAAFAQIKSALLPALPPGALVHHIGSTAVAGLAAKNIIDVQVTLPDLATLDPAALHSAGFERCRPTRDHLPPGMALPKADLAKLLFRALSPAANIHIREQGRFNQRYPLLCRDYLRAHPLAAAAYATIKHNLAARFPNDADAYYDIKDPVFDLIMSGAEAWAQTTHWQLPPPD